MGRAVHQATAISALACKFSHPKFLDELRKLIQEARSKQMRAVNGQEGQMPCLYVQPIRAQAPEAVSLDPEFEHVDRK